MNFWGIVGTLRKFGNFVVGLFPVLGRVFDFFIYQLKKVARIPGVEKWWSSFSKTDRGVALIKVFQRFFWRDYSSDRLELDQLPPDTVSSLRIIFILSILLCLLIPLAIAGNLPEVKMVMASGEEGSAPIWSIALWMISTAVAWGAITAGASVSNRVLAVSLGLLYVTIFGTVSLYQPRSYFNILLPLHSFISVALTERCLMTNNKIDWLKGILSSMIVGVPAGIYMLALTPLHSFNFGNTLLTGSIYGAIIALGSCLLGRILPGTTRAETEHSTQPAKTDVSKRVWLFSLINTAFLINIVQRGGWSDFGGELLSTISLWNGFLWPVWYFIGIGIIFKLLKNSKVFARGVKDSLPGFAFTPLVLILIVAGLLTTWSEAVVSTASLGKASPLIEKLIDPFFQIYRWSNNWLWKSPELNHTALYMRWVFTFEFIACLWLALKRKLNSEYMASLFYFMVLSTFLIYEYNFQQFSFIRTPSHSFVLLSFFALWLLWLFHRVGLKISLEYSPLWPSSGRLPLYGGILLFCLSEIHARCALEDYNIMNKIFLIMFRGIIDVGLPYFLYVFATRRFKELPIKLSTIFGIFCAGAVLTLPMNVLDKLSMCNWSIPQLKQLWQAQNELASTVGISNLPIYDLPTTWIFAKSILLGLSLYFIAAYTVKKVTNRKPAAIIFSTLAFTSGFSSFSKASVDLPFPIDIRTLITPAVLEMSLNANVIACYLSVWIPALIFCFAIAWKEKKSPLSWTLATACATIAYFFFNYFWPSQEAYLRSTGLLADCTILFGASLVYLLILAIRRIEARDPVSKDSEHGPPLVSTKTIHAIALVLYVAIIFHARGLFEPGKMVAHKTPVLERNLAVPLRWGKNIQTDPTKHAFFNYTDKTGYISSIIWSIRPTPEGGNPAVLKQLTEETAKSKAVANLVIYHKANWSKYYPGATAMYYNLELVMPKYNIPRVGITVMMPRVDKKTEIVTLLAEPAEFDQFEWDIVRMVKQSSKSAWAGKRVNLVELVKLSGVKP